MRIGQKVKINSSSEFFGLSGQLPYEVVATVYGVDNTISHELWYEVEWKEFGEVRKTNNYRELDLIPCNFKLYYEKIKIRVEG